MFIKQKYNTLLLFISISLTSCSSSIYQSFEEPILTENKFIINDNSVSNSPFRFLVDPKPNNKVFGIPIGLYVYKLSSENPDEEFNKWLNKRESRYRRLDNLISEKQINQLKRYNLSFNRFLKNLGEKPIKLNEVDVYDNISRIKQYYNNNGYFDTKIITDTIINENQAQIVYNVTTNNRYVFDEITFNINSNDIKDIINNNRNKSYLKEGEPFSIQNLVNERDRITSLLRNNGIYNYQQRSLNYKVFIDSLGNSKEVPILINIDTPKVNNENLYSKKKIRDIKIFVESIDEQSNFDSYTDSLSYNGIEIFSKGILKYSPKSLTEPLFFQKDELYNENKKLLTSRYYSNLGAFKYPRIQYSEIDNYLDANIYLEPRERFSLGFDLDFTHSNIEDFGISFGANYSIRNLFRGTENLSINLKNSIGASTDINLPGDEFFNLFELGGNLNLRIPRILFPIKLGFISKEMDPKTNIIIGSSVQKNIGLDKQYYNANYEISWNQSANNKFNFKLLDFEYVNNRNISNYFNVYRNSYDNLNYISSLYNFNQSSLDKEGNLIVPDGAENFINQVLNNQTSIESNSELYKDVNTILERKDRLTQNNLIVGSSISLLRNTQDNILDENFSQVRFKIETVGNLFNALIRKNNLNSNNKVVISDILPSQYFKTEINYIKHFSLKNNDIIATRGFFGIAIPYGNSDYIPFSRSYYAGGANDNRAWKAYKLGPGSSKNINEFNEANLKISFSIEYRKEILGKLKGALFIDSGNIWNVSDNVKDNSMKFNSLKDLSELAVGTGIGLRYDFNFFIFRLDTAFKTYNPSKLKTERWLTDLALKKAVFNIGINYPF